MATEGANRDNKVREIYPTEDDVAVALAAYIANLSDRFIKQKGTISVVLSGGTLIDTMRKLTEAPYVTSIEWSKWLIFFLDERVVPLDNDDSNYKLAYDGFLSKVPIPAKNVYHINYNPSAEKVAKDYDKTIKELVEKKTLPLSNKGFPVFDLMLLGMGPCGHVASLFPHRPQRWETEKWVTYITDSPKPPPPRITLTFPVINSSPEIAMVVTGSDLAGGVFLALGGENIPNDKTQIYLPVNQVKPEGTLTWFLDQDAARMLLVK